MVYCLLDVNLYSRIVEAGAETITTFKKLYFLKFLLKINMSNLLGRHLVGGNGKPKIIANLC